MTDEPKPMTHDITLKLVTVGPAPYGHKSWAEAIEAILTSELEGVQEAKVQEDWV